MDQYIAELIRHNFGGDPIHPGSSAPIVLPNREELTVRLVTQHSLDRLRDAESDRALFDSMMWCLLGGIVGFFTNVITGGQPVSLSGVIFVVMLGLVTAGVVVMRIRLGKRLKNARKGVGGDQ
ncbi:MULTISPECIES: hypothetical protein [Crossiella]|uniref:Uncharacterized protein n=1 Tax=Crossiella cryophila TaxID=43355 RepID=A0A7W7CBV8_9PSEU|nr:hypothetical protein [Crossiella cryophila]MBB4677041.1 hypothetical protein [Crossiella cryophila]